jgi:hypothetical protein
MNRDKDLTPTVMPKEHVPYSTGLGNERYVSSQKGVFRMKNETAA